MTGSQVGRWVRSALAHMSDTWTMDNIDPHGFGHIAAGGGFAAGTLSVLGIVTPIIGFVGVCIGIVYYSLSVYEMDTVQEWLKARRARSLARKVARLEAKQSLIIGELKKLGVLTSANTTVNDGATTTTTVETKTLPPLK